MYFFLAILGVKGFVHFLLCTLPRTHMQTHVLFVVYLQKSFNLVHFVLPKIQREDSQFSHKTYRSSIGAI